MSQRRIKGNRMASDSHGALTFPIAAQPPEAALVGGDREAQANRLAQGVNIAGGRRGGPLLKLWRMSDAG